MSLVRHRKSRRKRESGGKAECRGLGTPAEARLTFAELSRRIDEAIVDEPDPDSRWLWSLGLGGSVLPLILLVTSRYVDGIYKPALVIGAVAMQWSVLLAFLAQGAFKLRSSYRAAHSEFARELDRAYAIHGRLVRWLESFLERERFDVARFARARKETFARRISWMTGGIDKLGLLPVFGVAYLQLKDANLESLMTLERSDFMPAVLLALLVFVYAGFWWLLRLLNRLELYCELLDRSIAAGASRPPEPLSPSQSELRS